MLFRSNYSTNYYWKVKAINGVLTSDWSEVRRFTTEATPLDFPTLISPARGTGVTINPTLTWEAVPTAESYIVEVSRSTSFFDSIYTDTIYGTSVQVMGLDYANYYYWRVKAVRGITQSIWSQTFDFGTYIQLPNAPALVAPENLATSVACNPTLNWDAVTGIDSFLVQVSTTNAFNSFIVNEVVYTTSKGLTNLQYATQYFWRVRSIKTSELISNWSEVRSFTTMTNPNSTSTVLNIAVLLQGAWANNVHKEIAVTIELRKNNIGTTLASSVLYKRIPVFINSYGIATANFTDLETGDYWIVVRASGYLAIASKLKQNIQAGSVLNYDFTNSTNNAYSSSMLKLSNGRYLMKVGDLNNSRAIGSDDFGILKNNGSSSSTVPNL